MDKTAEILAAIDAFQAMTKQTDRAISLAVTDKPDLIRKMRETPRMPKLETLRRLAAYLGAPLSAWVEDEPALPSEAILMDRRVAWRDPSGRGDLPILGTALGHDYFSNGEAEAEIEQTIFEPGEVVKYVTRPAALSADPHAYAVYIQGDSMSPRFEPGELAIASTRTPPQINDDVIVQLVDDKLDPDQDAPVISVLIKRLVRRSASFVELRQFNPPVAFRVPTERIKHLHRITSVGDLLGA